MKALKAFFISRLLLEKILLSGFVLIIAILWFSNVTGRVVSFVRTFHYTSQDLATQRHWIDLRPDIEKESKLAVAQLDPSRTLDSARLQGELNSLATGLPNTQIDARPDAITDQFTEHSVQFSVRKADWATLQSFYVAVSKRAPYISIEQCSISADRGNPALLDATMLISSVEIIR
jgi:hypothetical protein